LVIIFQVQNTYTYIYGADYAHLQVFDKTISYPTEIAEAKIKGYDLPYVVNETWDGWIRFLRQPKTKPPWFPSGLLFKLIGVCQQYKIPFQVQDHRHRPEEQVPDFPVIDLRDYQQQAVKIAVEKGMGVLDMPPRSGKTRTMLEIVRRLGLPAIWIAPTERICAQTRDVIAGFFGMHFCYQLVGKAREKLDQAIKARIIICTTATAANLPQEVYSTREVLVIDEFHHAASKSYHQSIFPKCDHIFYRFGMTGTYFRSGNDEMALHAFLSETIYKITASILIEKGHLVPTQVVFVPVEAPKLRGMPNNTYQGGHGKYGIQEHRIRNQMVTWSTLFLANAGKKVLILVGTKKQGQILLSMIRAMLVNPNPNANYAPVEFLSTDTARPRQKKVIEAFLEEDMVKVLIGTSLLGEGVDLPTADVLVYAKGEKAEVSLTQNAYRVSTSLPGKTRALIVDFADRHHKKLLRHSQYRAAVYFHEPTFQVSVLDAARELPGWISENFLAQIEC
jgi:superfamily II DNA or RNA helicase